MVWETLLDNGEEMNDLVLLGVHLKSGQDYIHNHMAAMAKVVGALRHRDQILGIPKSEDDIVIMGDLNDSAHTRSGFRYIFDYVGSAGYVHLGSDLDDYSETRVNGSEIDHIFVSDDLMDHMEIITFQVHGVPEAERAAYRSTFSDHFPLTIDVSAVEDDD